MTKEEEYTYQLSPRSRVHVRFLRNNKEVLRFSANFEILFKREKKWKTVERFDNAHEDSKKLKWKFPHKHIYHNKKKQTIASLKGLNPKTSLNLAIKDFNNSFRSIKYRYFL